LGLQDQVVLMGSRNDARDLLTAADLYVQSSAREGMPISILEAMHACRPIVATDAGGTRELVRHDETGLLVPTGGAEPLAAALIDLLEDERRARRLALAARRLLVKRYDIRVVARSTEELYESVLGRRTG
jgi:glycosyltransferase involved in cell wall biosynthesis